MKLRNVNEVMHRALTRSGIRVATVYISVEMAWYNERESIIVVFIGVC